ncbi:helix-turn-helix domain-containing protein [Pseudomonas fragi]|uniref:AraC family transcriptional regulator n=1 Tax=Pseudomonas fragi TaxID=296 RepID=A0A449IS60_PSEFR|nr:AraC family transcriptional regulator [Pseudomonas fragi]
MLRNCESISSKSPGLNELRDLLLSTSNIIHDNNKLLSYSSVRNGLRQALLTGLITTFANPQIKTANQRTLAKTKIVKKAKEFVLENTLEPVTIAELCEFIGVSRRTLQMCFQEIMGTNPVQYLRAVRLNRVRRNLRLNETGKLKVQDVACHWGFWHLSSFTADYKRMFGELPSHTLYRTA